MTLSLSGGPKGAGAQGRGDGVQGQSLGEGSGALPLPGLGGMGASGEVGCRMSCSGVARPHKKQPGRPRVLPAKYGVAKMC